MPELPSGDVTFAFIDVVGSTALLEQNGADFVSALSTVHRRIATAAVAGGGTVVSTEGDGAFLAFPDAGKAAVTLVDLQSELEKSPPVGPHLRVRIGMHRGHAVPVDGNYVALPVHIASRVCSAAGPGQVLSTGTVAVAGGVAAEDLGRWSLRGVAAPVGLVRLAGNKALPRATPLRRTNVPVARTSFLGRQDLVERLEFELTEPGLVTLVGPGGVGKTRLASEVTRDVSHTLAGGAWLVSLSSVDATGDVVAAIAGTLDVPLVGADPIGVLGIELGRRDELLLTLDNCEHVIELVAEVVERLLTAAPALRVMCTSREALRLSGECVLRVDPLGCARDFFVERATAAGAVIGPQDRTLVGQICSDLDGLPLAIELAAARSADVPLPELSRLIAELGHGKEIFARRDGDARQRNLDNLVGWSDELLAPEQRRALRVLAVLPGDFSAELARAVLQNVAHRGLHVDPNALPELSRRSLLDRDGDRFRLLHVVRAVARRWLADDADLQEAAEHALIHWAAEWGATHASLGLEDLLTDAKPHLAVLAAATTCGLGRRHLRLGLLARCLFYVHRAATLPPELPMALLEVFAWPEPRTEDDVVLRCYALGCALGSGLEVRAVDPEKLLALVASADAVARTDVRLTARLFVARALPPAYADLKGALIAEALPLADRGTVDDRSRVLNDMGVQCHVRGDVVGAVALYREGLSAVREDQLQRRVLTVNLCEALLDLGEPRGALDAALAAQASGLDHPTLRGIAEAFTGEAYAALGLPDEGRRWLRQAYASLEPLAASDQGLRPYLERVRRGLAREDGAEAELLTTRPTRASKARRHEGTKA